MARGWYGLEVGDQVVMEAFGYRLEGIVIELDSMDKNGGWVRAADGEPYRIVCEWCKKISGGENNMNQLSTKIFEIRDSATFIPVLATKLQVLTGFQDDESVQSERYLLLRCGYHSTRVPSMVMVTRLDDCLSANDPHEWAGGARTMPVAHEFIMKNFDSLESGSVVDVEFILGLSPAPKVSERLK